MDNKGRGRKKECDPLSLAKITQGVRITSIRREEMRGETTEKIR